MSQTFRVSRSNQDRFDRRTVCQSTNHGATRVCRGCDGTGLTETSSDFVTMDYIDENRVNVIYQIPLAEIVFDFDKLKSSTRGYEL